MIRPFTLLCAAACVGSGMFLYTEKHNAEMIDRQIAHVIHQTLAARERAGLLRADWALLNDPARIQTMADSYLALKPMAPSQFVQMGDLASRLPPAVAPGPDPVNDSAADIADAADPAKPDEAAKPAELAATDMPRLASADPGLGDAPAAEKPARPAATAAAKAPAAAKPVTKLAHAAPRRAPHAPAHDEYAQTNPLAHSAPLPLASPQPMAAHLVSAMARPSAGRYLAPRPVSAVPRVIGAAPYVGSALAGAGSLPPPVPLGN